MKYYKFSIIVPIFNIEKFLEKCLDSVLYQKYANWELILVDDGSTDNCPDICDKYVKKDCRIRVIHKKNCGLPAARNSGLAVCTGDYILHLDGDDFLADNCLGKLNNIVQTNKELYLGNGRYDYYSDDNIINVHFYDKIDNEDSKESIINRFFGVNAPMPSAVWHNIYRNNFIQERKLFFSEELTWSEDKDYFFNVLFNCENIEVFDYNFYYYRHDNISAMTKHYTMKNVMSNASVSVKWFFKIDELEVKNREIIKRRLSEELIYCVRFLGKMNNCDRKKFKEFLKSNYLIMNYTNTKMYKIILILSKIIGLSATGFLWKIIKK